MVASSLATFAPCPPMSRPPRHNRSRPRSRPADADPGLTAILTAKALALGGDLPDCRCYAAMSEQAARAALPCEHVMAAAVRSLQDAADPEAEDDFWDSPAALEATDTEPGSAEKKKVLRDRVKMRRSVCRPGDRVHSLTRLPAHEEEGGHDEDE